MTGFRASLLTALLLAVLVATTTATQAANPFRGSGFQLDEGDAALLEAAAARLYRADDVAVGAVETWRNPATGNSGTVTLIAIHEQQGMPCRRLQHDIELTGVKNPYRFTVDRCRTGDGEWKILAP